jgi:hypothetical protein
MSEAWIESFTSLKVDLLDPKPEMITIEDIAHSLSQLCRFTGHTKYFYSVGQHSLLGSHLVPTEDALWFLLHDASEAYAGDMNRPLKHFSKAGVYYQEVEKKLMSVICTKFGLSQEEPPSVKVVDNGMLYAEKRDLMGNTGWTVDWGGVKTPANVLITKMGCEKVEKYFLKRFRELTNK